MANKAVLLVNLGSPDAADVKSVRRYLNQFLMDPYVITLPWLLRRLLVSLLVLPSRPKTSAHAYQSVWTKQGSPLSVLSQRLLQSLQQKSPVPIALAMRYGKPSIESQIKALTTQHSLSEIILIPLYPHYAQSTVLTSIKATQKVIAANKLAIKLTVLPPFYENDDYIASLLATSAPWLEDNKISATNKFEHILFSYHGLPESHLKKADPSKKHCLQHKDCCSQTDQAHATCYRHQVLRTTQCFVARAGLTPDQYSVSFQSRLGRQQWLEPSTEKSLQDLAQRGIKNLAVICPAFVTDCLETLEEIEIQGSAIFKQAGGQNLALIPCLNDQAEWVDTLLKWIKTEL